MSFLALNNQNHQPTLILMIWNFSLLWGSKIAFEFASRRWCAIDLEGSLRYGLSHHLITVKNDKRNHYKKWLLVICDLPAIVSPMGLLNEKTRQKKNERMHGEILFLEKCILQFMRRNTWAGTWVEYVTSLHLTQRKFLHARSWSISHMHVRFKML
jgi:hypothetical protein